MSQDGVSGVAEFTNDQDQGWQVTYTDENNTGWILNAQNSGHARSLAERMSVLHKAATVHNAQMTPVFAEAWVNGQVWRP